MTHLDALMVAYYGNNLPATASAQKSKFGNFITCGQIKAPIVAVVQRAIDMIGAKRLAAEQTTSKEDKKALTKEADAMNKGLFEKCVNLAREQKKAKLVMLDDATIMGIINPVKAPSADPLADALEELQGKVDNMAKAFGVFSGYPEITQAIVNALAVHHAKSDAPMIAMPQPQVGTAAGEVKVEVQENAVVTPGVIETPAVTALTDLADADKMFEMA